MISLIRSFTLLLAMRMRCGLSWWKWGCFYGNDVRLRQVIGRSTPRLAAHESTVHSLRSSDGFEFDQPILGQGFSNDCCRWNPMLTEGGKTSGRVRVCIAGIAKIAR